MRIRPADILDLTEVTLIYSDAVLSTTATFELTPPDLTEMAIRWQKLTGGGYPYLVAEVGGAIAGYAYAGPYHSRPAYASTVETSIYVNGAFQRQGVGTKLLSELIDASERLGFRQMIAVIGGRDMHQSVRLHDRQGFRKTGELKNVGYKHDAWHDVVIMQRALGAADLTPPKLINQPPART